MTIVWGQGPWGGGSWGGGLVTTGALKPGIPSGYGATLRIDEATGDLAKPIEVIRGPAALAQKIRTHLRFFKGEWFLDQRLGVDWFRYVFVKNPNLTIINSLLRNSLLAIKQGVVAVKSVSVSITDRKNRGASASFEALISDGLVLTARDEPFVVNP